MYACFCPPDSQMTLQTRGLVSLWLGEGGELQTKLVTLQSECPVAVCVLQSEAAACPSSAGSKGTERAGSRSVQECHLGSPVGKRPSTRACSSCLGAPGFCGIVPKSCAKLNPALTTHILQQGFTAGCAPGAPVHSRNVHTTAVKTGKLLIPTVM